MQTTYHFGIAIGHFARKLAVLRKPNGKVGRGRQHGAYQTIALLSALWHRVRDPFAASAVVFVSAEYLQGIVSGKIRLNQLAAELRNVGALHPERVDGSGFRLLKPKFDELDDLARAEIERAQELAARASEMAEQAQHVVRVRGDDDEPRTKTSEGEAAQRRREALEREGKQFSDVRDVLATLAKMKRDDLVFAGKGAGHVRLAADFIVVHGWRKFVCVCRAVNQDSSPDKPDKIEWLFAERHADYLSRFVQAS